jgi:dTMP kinase
MAGKKGKFLVIDGIDASGKGTIVMALTGWLTEKKKVAQDKVLVTFEPTGGKSGAEVRKLLASEDNPEANAEKCLELYVKDRREHLKQDIEPALKEGKIVICDRFKYSTIAYQKEQGIGIKEILAKHKGMKKPDLVLILDVPSTKSMQRIESDPKRKMYDKFEKEKFLEKVRMSFLNMPELLKGENIKVIDASRPIEEVFADVQKEVSKIL